jgi:hypothetical protein
LYRLSSSLAGSGNINCPNRRIDKHRCRRPPIQQLRQRQAGSLRLGIQQRRIETARRRRYAWLGVIEPIQQRESGFEILPNNAWGQLHNMCQRIVERATTKRWEWRGLAQPNPTIIGRHLNDRAKPRRLAPVSGSEWHHIWDSERNPCDPNNTHLGVAIDLIQA